jgi:predicted ATP-grasp superfamily ATP-dependent carboligase
MIQEYVPGEIRDVCVIFNKGEPRGALVQKRMLTYPPTGGVGIVNRTINEPEVRDLAIKLLKCMKWHGVAQVEFKLDKNGVPKLMEINPKFWGTLELSIAAGLDFPYMLYRIEKDGDVDSNFSYLNKTQIWWISAHYPHLFLSYIKKSRTFWEALSTDSLHKISDVHIDDLLPHLVQFFEGIGRLLQFRKIFHHPASDLK